ncbi:hypothetical protein [Photorhabdus asymbiotica]|uniref:hypothetical protein n=1 Tax=Photorhabdus asymbiotica TaxID=291112 RepID=UPI003DA740DB
MLKLILPPLCCLVPNLLRGAISSRDGLQLTSSADVSNTGKLLSQSAVNLQAKGALENQGRVEARSDTTVTAGTIHSSHDSVWAAGLDDKGNTTCPGSLALTAQHVQANGKNLATDTLAVHSQQIDLSDSQTAASQIQLNANQHRSRHRQRRPFDCENPRPV